MMPKQNLVTRVVLSDGSQHEIIHDEIASDIRMLGHEIASTVDLQDIRQRMWDISVSLGILVQVLDELKAQCVPVVRLNESPVS